MERLLFAVAVLITSLVCASAHGQAIPPAEPASQESPEGRPQEDRGSGDAEAAAEEEEREPEAELDQEPSVEPAGGQRAEPATADDVTGQLQEAAAEPETADDVTEEADAEADAEPESTDDATGQLEGAAAEEETTPQDVAAEDQSGDNISQQLVETKQVMAGLFKHGPISDLYNLWKPWRGDLKEQTGLDLGFAYTTLMQVASGGPGDRDGWSGDIDVFGHWNPFDVEDEGGYLGFLVEQRHRLAGTTPRDLGFDVGSLWGSTRAFNTQDLALAQLWWRQSLLSDHVTLVLGKVDPTNYFNANRFQNQNTFFVNPAFSGNPTRAFPSNSLGVAARVEPDQRAYVGFGIHDTNGQKTTSGFGDLDIDELFYVGELGVTPFIEGLGQGRYRFTAWYSGAGRKTEGESGRGFALSFDQEIGDGLVPFFRYGYQDRELTDTRQIVAGGLAIQRPFGRSDDIAGLGVSWGQPSDRSLRDQYVTELFYRHQLTPKVQITPGYQVIIDPSTNPDQDVIGIFSLRVRVTF